MEGEEQGAGAAGEPPALPVKAEEDRAKAGVWGVWATVGIGVGLLLLFVVAQLAVAIVVMFAKYGVNPEAMANVDENDGFLLSVSAIGGAVVLVPAVFVAAWLKRGVPVRDYLKVFAVERRVLLTWAVVVAVLSVLTDRVMAEMIEDSKGLEFMKQTFLTAGWLPVYYLGLVVAAPLSEEVLFRGFLFEGLAASRLGAWGANVVTSAGWALIHTQYGMLEITTLFFGGLLFGYGKMRTGSLVTPVVMHAVWNLMAVVQTQLMFG